MLQNGLCGYTNSASTGLKVPGLVFGPDTVPRNARYARSANFQIIMNGHLDPRSNTSDRVLLSNFVPQTHA